MDNGLNFSEFGCLDESACPNDYCLATVVLECGRDFSYGCDFRLDTEQKSGSLKDE